MFQSPFCNITVLFLFIYLLRRTSGRMTGWRFTPGRGWSSSSTWWRNRTETGRPESFGPSYRCTLPSETKCDTHLCDLSKNLTVQPLCLSFTAQDPPVFYRCGGCPRSPPRRLMGRKRSGVCRRPRHLRPSLLLWPFRVRAGYCWDVRWLQQLFLLRLP